MVSVVLMVYYKEKTWAKQIRIKSNQIEDELQPKKV